MGPIEPQMALDCAVQGRLGACGIYSEVAAFGAQSGTKPVRDGFGRGQKNWPYLQGKSKRLRPDNRSFQEEG
jgi:hypothetical protein